MSTNALVGQLATEGVVAGSPNARVSQFVVEVLDPVIIYAEVSQAAVESVLSENASAEVSQAVIEVLWAPFTYADVGQVVAEAVMAEANEGLVVQLVVEVVGPYIPPASQVLPGFATVALMTDTQDSTTAEVSLAAPSGSVVGQTTALFWNAVGVAFFQVTGTNGYNSGVQSAANSAGVLYAAPFTSTGTYIFTIVGIDATGSVVVSTNIRLPVVATSSVTIPVTAMPWVTGEGKNTAFPFGLGNGTSPVVAASNLTFGDTVTVAASGRLIYAPGNVSCDPDGVSSDVTGSTLDTTTSTYYPTAYMDSSSFIPAGTRSATVTMTATGGGGTTSGGYADNISLAVNGSNNLVANPGAETGDLTGWTVTSGSIVVQQYGVTQNPDLPQSAVPQPNADCGTYFFSGGVVPLAVAEQTVDLSAFASVIDDGTAVFELSAWLGGYYDKPSEMALLVEWLDSGGNILGTASVGPVTETQRDGVSKLLFEETQTTSATLGVGGLCGAFTDNSGNVIEAVQVGSQVSLSVPNGATTLQLGVNSVNFLENAGGPFVANLTIS